MDDRTFEALRRPTSVRPGHADPAQQPDPAGVDLTTTTKEVSGV